MLAKPNHHYAALAGRIATTGQTGTELGAPAYKTRRDARNARHVQFANFFVALGLFVVGLIFPRSPRVPFLPCFLLSLNLNLLLRVRAH